MGGARVAVATCQLLPPSMPGHARYCPYSTGPQHGAYRGPDLARAKQLVTASGTRGTRVVVADLVGGPQPPLNGYLARVLREIGYRTSIHHVADTQRNRRYYFSDDSETQAEAGGWFADFPQPSNFYDLVACGSAAGYPLHYCNRHLDRRAAHADALLRTDPGTALPAWADIDRAVTDQAPLVPVSNPVDWWLYSGRVGNYQNDSRDIGPLLSQLWVR